MALLVLFSVCPPPPCPSLLDSEAVPREGGQERPHSLPATGAGPDHFLTCTLGGFGVLHSPSHVLLNPRPALGSVGLPCSYDCQGDIAPAGTCM